MKKIALTLLTIFSLFVISCEIGLGASVDTDAPSLEILNPPVDSVIRDTFALSGTWADDGNIASVNVALKRTDISGETKNIAGTLAGDIRLGGSGTWSAEIVPVAEDGTKLISDGSYQATVTIKDTVGRTTIRNTTFTIDNTPPVIVLTRPSTAADSLSSDTYGQTFNLEGQAADTNNVSLIEVMIYSDAECTNHIHTVPLKNVPNSINMDVAKFVKGDTENDYFKIYGESTTEGGPKQFYCKVVAYDGAQRFPADGSAQTEADQKGNGIDTYYLYKDIATTILQNYKITEVYSMLNGTYTASGTARSVSVEDVMTLLNTSKKTQGKFTLNPKNNPTFAVTGRNPLLLNGSDFTGSANNISDGTKVVIEVSPGLDGILLEESSLKVFAVECDLNGKKTGTPIALDFDKEESGTSYRLITKIDKAKGLVIGRNYLFDVQGWDQSESKNYVEPVGLAYGFHMATSGKAPVLELTTPPSSTSYTNESKQVFVGSVSVEDGVPKVIVTYNNTEYEITNFTTSANGNETKYSFEWESPDFGDSNSTHQFEFKAVMDTDSQPIERTIVHDIDKPVIGDLKINEAKKYYRTASHEHYEDGQTYPERYLNATVNASIDITDSYDAIKTATYKIILNDNEAAATEVAMVNPAKFVFPPLDTTQIIDGTKVTIKVVASDRAGNTETHTEEFIVDQETNIPFVYPKDHESLSLKEDAQLSKIAVTASSSFVLKVYDDDGVSSGKLAITAQISNKVNPRTADATEWTTLASPTITLVDDDITIRVPESGGFYKYKITVKDIANDKTYEVPEFVINAAMAQATITSITKTPDYIQNITGKSFTITIDGISSQGPYTLFRKIEGVDSDFVPVNDNLNDFPITDIITLASNNSISEGTKVYYYVLDGTPRPSNKEKFVSLTFDDDAPTLTITSPSVNKTGTSALSEPIMFGGSSSDAKSGIAKVYYRFTQDPNASESTVSYEEIDSSTQPLKSSPFTIDKVIFGETTQADKINLAEGKWYFQAYAEDAAGNISATDVKEFDINLSAPLLTVTVNTENCKLSGGAYYFKGDFTGTVTSSDTGGSGTVEFFIGDSNTAVLTWDTINNSNKTFLIPATSFTESVQQKLTIKATDTFGKVTSETINVYKDTTIPDLSVTNPGDQTTAAVTIRGTANDAGVGVKKIQWSISGDPGTYDDVTTFNHNSPNWSLSVADLGSEGTKEYYFKAVDALNNTTAAESVSFMYDMAAPSITTKSGSETLTSSTTKPVTTTNDKFKFTIVESNGLAESDAVTLSVKQGETSLALNTGYTIKDGETSITELSSLQPNKEYTIEINSYTDALYSYEISARDKAGKTSGLVTRSIRLDTKAPVIDVTSPDFKYYQNSKSINVNGTCEDDSGTLAVWYATGATAPAIPTGDLTLENTWTSLNTWKNAEGTSSWTAKNIPGAEGTPTKIYFVAVDKNGIATKASDIVTKEYKVDLYNPSFEETSIGEGKAYKNASYTFSGKASDTGSGIKSIVISAGSNTYAWYKNPSDETSTTSGFTYDSSTGNWSYTVSVASAEEQEYNYTLTVTDGADKTTTLSRTVVYDKTKPVIAPITAGSWYKTRTITIAPTITENGSGVDTVEASLIAYDEADPDADRGWIDIPLSNGAYKGTVDFADDGKDQKIYIRAKDKAGNYSDADENDNDNDETVVSVNIDTTDPDLEKLKYKVGNTSLKDIGGTVYINATNGITVYGSYSDDLSGVKELSFAGDGYKTDVSDENGGYKKPAVTYSTATSIPTGKTVEDLTYAAYAAANADKIKYWKAVFTNDILDSGKLSVTGKNSADGSKTINLFAIDKDTVPPTFKNEKIEPDTEKFSVYKTKEGSGASEKTVYYLNHEKQKFNISGLASDANTAVDQVYIKIYKIDENGYLEIDDDGAPIAAITDNNATGYFSNIQFADYVKDSEGNITETNFWDYGAKVVITTTDIAGNSTADNNTETVLNIKFDSESPTSKHDEIDATGKDLVFRIGDSTNDDITETNAAQYGLTWNQYTDTTTSKTYTKIDEAAGGKYSGGSFGNSYTQKVRGNFTDSGSGLKQVFYKIYDREESKIFDKSTKEEKYDLTDAQKEALIEDVVSANQYFAPLSTPEYKRVFYNVKKGTSDTLGGKQLYENSEPVIERKIKNDGSWLTIKDTTDPAYASATQFYKYWKIEEANYSFTIPQLNEGSNYLVIVAEDNVGNFYVDTSDPIDHDGNPSTPARKYSNFSMNVDTIPPVIELKDSTGEEYTTEVRYSDGGDYNIEVKVTDFGVVDTTEPTGYVPNTSSGIKKVELTTSEGTVKCSPKSGTTNIYTGNVKTILKNNKTLTVSATAYDVAGSSSTKVVANVMVDTTAPTVTLTAPTDADKTTTETEINGTITISGTASDPNGSGLNAAVALYYYKVVSETAAAPAKPEDNAKPEDDDWDDDWITVTGVTPSGTSPWSFENVDTTAIDDGSRVYFTAAVRDNAGNVGYSSPVEVFIDQDSDRPVIKITSMSLSGMASNNRAGSKEPELTGSVSDDDEVPNALAYRIGDTGDFTDSGATGSSLSYSSSDGQFTLTLDDGPQNVYFKVTTNEKDENDKYVTFETKLNPATTDIQAMPKLTDRGGIKYGYKDSTTTTTVIYLAVDTEAPETEDFAFTRTPTDASSWSSAISGEYFGGSQRQKFYLREYAYDANGVKQVYLSLPANEADGLSNAITAWTYKNEQTRVTKTVYTIGNQPAVGDDYWLITTASGTKTGTLSSASTDHKTITIASGDNAGIYTRSAYIFQLKQDTSKTNGKDKYYLWQSAYDKNPDDEIIEEDNPVDVTNLASGERNATLVTYDGTRQTTETKIIRVDNTAPTINISAPTSVTSTAVVNGSIVGESEKTTVSFAVTKTDVTDGSTITSWTEEEKAGTSSFKVNFDGGDENDAYETHTSLLKQYLITLGILTQNDIDTKSAKARQLQPVHVWIKSEDNCNNIAYNKALVYVDALGNIPTVTIGYPTSDGQTLGGSVSIMGTAKDNVDPKYVWIQFDITGTNRDSPSYVPAWTMDDYNIIKSDYQFGNMKTNEDVAAADVTTSNIADIGIKVPVEGGSWSQIINTLRLFPNSTATANDITMWVYATDDDNGDGTVINVSRAETRTFSVDKDNPYFVQDTLKLVQYEIAADPTSTKKRELVYKEGMYIRGIWWLEGEVRDESSGINEVKKNDYGDNNQYGEYSDNLVSQTTEDIYFTPKLDGTKTNYTFKIKVGDESESGRNRFKIKAWENKSPDTRDDEKEFIIYYDNKDPTFNAPANSSDGIAKEVKNSDGFYGLHSTAYEANTNDSGVERVAVYFTRTIASGANAGTYIFDPMYKRGYEIDEKDVSKIKIDDSLVQDTTGDKLYWGSAKASGLAGVKVTLTTEVASYVHVGGLAKIDGFVYRILEISSDKKTVTLSSAPHNLTSDKKVYFAVANVVDNTKDENLTTGATSGGTSEYGYGYPVFAENVDDGDGIREYLKNIDTTTWNWNLYINSKNIPDGAITIHYVIFDKAGNSAYGSVEDASVENNQPRLVSVKIGRDVNQDGSIATTNPETITYYKNGSTEVEDKPSLYKNGLTSIDIPKIVVKSTMEVTPEIVGGNGKIYYKIKKGAETTYTGYGTSGAGIELMDGNDDYDNAAWTDASDHVKEGSLDTKTATITHNLVSSNPVRYQQLISANNATWSLSYELYDSKEAGEVNKVYINIPEIDFAVYDEEAPSVAITPFYWKQDGDIKKSSAIYEDVEIDGVTKTIARGHIDLKRELPSTFNGTGVNDGDDKVSGIIKIEGTATDTRKLSALYIQVPGMEAWFGEDNANLPQEDFGSENSSDIYYQISTYNGTSWTDKAGNLSTYGFAFQTSGNSLTDTGHTVNWTFTWDTSKISTVTDADVNIKVLAEDAASEASASDNNPQNKTTVGPLKVDVVPYITKLVTDISESAGEEFARSATGKYIVKGSYLDTDKTTVKTETVKVYGFNLALTANSKNSSASIGSGTGTLSAGDTDATGSYLNMAIGATTTSGKLAITVNDISSLNNVNQNPEFEDGAVSAKTNSKAMYNSQANNETNNRLTDDVELVVWDMNYFLNEVDITSPMMKMDKSGNYYMSYGHSTNEMYVKKNDTTETVDYSFNKFHNTSVTFDDNGNLYATAMNTDRVQDESSRFVLYVPFNSNLPDYAGENVYNLSANAGSSYNYCVPTNSKRHLELAYNGEKGIYNVNRVKLSKLTTYTPEDSDGNYSPDSYIAMSYYDGNNTINPVKFRYGKRAAPVGYVADSDTKYTFTYSTEIKNGKGYGYNGTQYYTEGWKVSSNEYTNDGKYVKIGENYYKLKQEGSNRNNYELYYSIENYNSTTGFDSEIYSYIDYPTFDGGIAGSIPYYTTADSSESNDPDTTDSSYKGYHIIASDSTTKKGGEYTAVGIVPAVINGVTKNVGVVAWYDANARQVCYSYNEDLDNPVVGGAWQTHAKYIDTAKYSGWYVDLAVDEDGGIHIAYYNSAKGDLKYVYLPNYNYTDNNTVNPVTVDSYLSVGTNITVNVRKQGDNCVPYIYYYNASSNQTSNSIKVAWQNDATLRNGAVGDKFTGAWECMTIPSANVPVDATVCGGVPTGTHTGTNVINYSKTLVLGYMTDKYYEKAYIKGDITSANW